MSVIILISTRLLRVFYVTDTALSDICETCWVRGSLLNLCRQKQNYDDTRDIVP